MTPSSSSSLVEKFYIHHFYYKLTQLEDNVHLYLDKYVDIIGFEPEVMNIKDGTLYVKLLTKLQNVHTVEILNNLEKYGIHLKLTRNQSDLNSVYCTGIPPSITKEKKENILKALSLNSPNIKFLDIYVLPLKEEGQNFTSAKITLATQEMVNLALNNGLQISTHAIYVSQITRAKILGSPQCYKCFSFDHLYQKCTANAKCLHCSNEHMYKVCPNKNKSPTCGNCKSSHKSNSNNCPIEKNYLITPKANKDPEVIIERNPETSYKEANIPTTNPWFDKQKTKQKDANNTQSAPKVTPPPTINEISPVQINATSSSDCFNMALKFNNPFKAFTEIQKAFGLKVFEIPESLHHELKPEFAGDLFVPPSPLNIPEKISLPPTTSPSTSMANNSIEIPPIEPPPLSSDEENKFIMQISKNKKRTKSRGRNKR